LDAFDVLNEANKLLKLSFYKRDELNKIRPELNINRWDAGWKQIKALINYCNIDLQPFSNLYKLFEKRLLDETKKLGFLR
jgi:hypothetical protein